MRLFDQARAAHVTRREPAVGVRREDPQLDQPAQLLDADAGPLGCLGELVRLHALECSGRRRDRDTLASGTVTSAWPPD